MIRGVHKRFSFKESLQEGKEGCFTMVSTKSKLNKKKRIQKGKDKHIDRSSVKVEKNYKLYVKMVTTKGHNRLSFVIVVKGREDLGVAINEKGGDCWKYGMWLSLMSKGSQ